MKKTNPSKAQLRRDNARLHRAAARHADDAKSARAHMLAADRQCHTALRILTELQPDLAKLIVHPLGLPPDPGLERILSEQPPSMERLLEAYAAPSRMPDQYVEHWLTRVRFWCEAHRPEDGLRMLVFRMQRPKGEDALGWQYAFDDRLLARSPTALREMILHMAGQLADELAAKIGRNHH